MKIPEKSSILPLVSQLLASYPQLSGTLSKPLTVNLIIDTNVIIGELLWLTQKRKNKNAVTRLLELNKNKTITAYAPEYLKQEIEDKIPEISQKKNIQAEPLLAAWQSYKQYITFVPHRSSNKLRKLCSRDPKDAPFIALQLKYGYPIYSKDKDIAGMGGQIISVEIIADLKEYSKHAETAYSIKIAGMGSFILTTSFVNMLIIILAKIPKKFTGIMFVVFILLLINPSSRKYMFNLLKKAKLEVSNLLKAFIDFITPFVEQYEYNNKVAENKKELITKHFSRRKPAVPVAEF